MYIFFILDTVDLKHLKTAVSYHQVCRYFLALMIVRLRLSIQGFRYRQTCSCRQNILCLCMNICLYL